MEIRPVNAICARVLATGLVLLMACVSHVHGQRKITIAGTVQDAQTGESIAGVTVACIDLGSGALTDFEGAYAFSLTTNAESVMIKVRDAAYVEQAKMLNLSKVQPGDTVWAHFSMEDPLNSYVPCYFPTISIWGSKDTQAGEMDRLKPKDLQVAGNFSTETALNSVPGVRFDSRGPGGSRRLAIRGSVIRSPFGVQNIRAYVDGTPLSSPDGSTPIELLDVANIGEMLVEKGPLGDEYGPGNNGVLHVESNLGGINAGAKKVPMEVEFMAGSYGYFRWMAGTGLNTENKKIAVRYIGQRYAGYREQEANRKQMVFLASEFSHRYTHKFKVSGWYYEGEWELPGALTQAQVDENPRQAVPFSVNGQARVDRHHSRVNLGHEYVQGRFSIASTAYGNYSTKINPYGTSVFFEGYKDESALGAGARVVAAYGLLLGRKIPLSVTAGAEYQAERNQAWEFNNAMGQPGTQVRNAMTIVSEQGNAFAGLSINQGYPKDNHHDLALKSGISFVNYTAYLRPPLGDNSLFASSKFGPKLLPSLTYTFAREARKPFLKLMARVTTGYSPPSREELIRDNGEFWPGLRSERSLSAEVRPAVYLLNRRILAEVSAYTMTTNNALVVQQLISGNVYANAAQIGQNGIEAYLKYATKPEMEKSRCQVSVGAALQDYRYLAYLKDSVDLGGNRLPGVPQFTLFSTASTVFLRRIQPQLTARYQGNSPANDENTVFQPAYLVLNAQVNVAILGDLVGYESLVRKQDLRLTIGMNNILNTQYTNFLAINAFGGRYWNPAPGRNVFGGIQMKF